MLYLKESFENLSAKYLDEYIWKSNTLIIDLRDEDEYLRGHIQNAVNLPYERLMRNDFNFPKDYELVLYCERGGLSLLAARTLEKLGFHGKNVVGGINAYRGKIY